VTPTLPHSHTLSPLLPRQRSRDSAPLLGFLSLLSVLLYLITSYTGGFLGFPLDDAWIHQTYARNLATRGEFAFISGQPSAGSTSPLWSGLLAIGYLFKIDYRVWTYALGAALLTSVAWLAHRFTLTLWPEHKMAALLAGVFITLEWHLVWTAVSGMETLLFIGFMLLTFVIPPRRAGWIGLCVGLSVLARPDGLTLLPFALARMIFSGPVWGRRLLPTFRCVLGFGAVFVPYLLFNRWLSGNFWPNTFYAKQAEYAVLRELPLSIRLARLGLLPFVGAQVLLLPGIAVAVWQWGREHRWDALIPLGWTITFIIAYALRLPVIYQHGRYLIPVIPVLIVLGVGGAAAWLRLKAADFLPRVLSRAWLVSIGLALVAFWLMGAGAYRRDVQIIETEMVATARWVSQNTPPEALMAAHDIGALGYFSGRRLLDMAGLVSPEVIPFIRDENRLRDWLTRSGADYLVAFPDWYPELVRPLATAIIFSARAPYSPAAGGTNMTVYRWPGDGP
jgi:hypothetical protein